MATVTLGMNISIDGFIAQDDGALDWMYPQIDSQRVADIIDELSQIDVFLMGRKTYQGMVAHWPTAANDPIAPIMNQARKIVFSRTLTDTTWENAEIADTSPSEVISTLRVTTGLSIGVAGGAQFAQSLAAQGLVDRYNLAIHPVALGKGLPLFSSPLPLHLVDSKVYQTGLAAHAYAARES